MDLSLFDQFNAQNSPGGPGPLPGPQLTPPAPVQLPQLPGPRAAQLPPPPRSMSDHMGSMIGIHNGPTGYEGFLTPDEIGSARPSLFSSVFGLGGTPQEQYDKNLENLAKRKLFSAQAQQAQATQGRIEAIRKQFTPQEGETPEMMYQRLLREADAFATAGDPETASKLALLVKDMRTGSQKAGVNVGPGDVYVDAATGRPMFTNPLSKNANQGTPALWKGPNGEYVGILPGDNATIAQYAKLGYKPDLDARTEFVQGQTNNRFTAGERDKLVKGYKGDIKSFTDDAKTIDKALLTIEAANNNPDPAVRRTMYGPAMSQFVQSAEQSKNLRFQLLDYYSRNIDPSIGGKWEVLKSRLLNGSLPQYTLNAMVGHLHNLQQRTYDQIESHRNEFMKNNPQLDETQVPTTSSYMPFFAPTATGTAPAGPVDLSGNPFRKGKKP